VTVNKLITDAIIILRMMCAKCNVDLIIGHVGQTSVKSSLNVNKARAT